MSGSQIEDFDKFVIDTNVIFMALYDINSKAGRVIRAAIENKIRLYAPDSVKEEIFRVLKREMLFDEKNIADIISSLPISWIDKKIYEFFLTKTKVFAIRDKKINKKADILTGIPRKLKITKNRIETIIPNQGINQNEYFFTSSGSNK